MATTKMIDSPLAVSTQLIRIELLITRLETTPVETAPTPQLCSILAIVNGASPMCDAGFSGGAVNALSKNRAATFCAEHSAADTREPAQFTMSCL